MAFTIECEQEEDGRWIAEVLELPGVLAYGQTHQTAISKVQSLARRVLTEQFKHWERHWPVIGITFTTPP
ncbi:MAG: type II toxin-antitoxin system HicB family antitoxin [Chloroflexia bacterium]